MKLRTLDKLFWDYFKECPRKACFLYQKNQSFGMSVKRFKKIKKEEFRYFLLEKIFMHILNSKDDEKELKKKIIAYLNKEKFDIKNSKKYSDEEKEYIITTIELMRDLEDLEILLKLMKQDDFKEFDSLKIKLKLSNYIDIKTKTDFEYEIFIPVIQYLDKNEIKIVMFNHNGYPNFIYEYESDINIIKKFIKQDTNNKLREIIIYDFKSMCRYSMKVDVLHLKEIKSILTIIDKGLLFFNSKSENCLNCTNLNNCINIMKKGEKWTL